MHDQNNVFFAIALSIVILISWQYFFATSFLGKPSTQKTSQNGAIAPGLQPQALGAPAAAKTQPFQPLSRQQAIARSQRVAIDTPRLKGSIAFCRLG